MPIHNRPAESVLGFLRRQQAHRLLISAVDETGIVRKDAHGLQGKDRHIDRIAAAECLCRSG